MVPRYAIDAEMVAPSSKAASTFKKKSDKKERKFVRPPEKPHKIEEKLRDPEKRKHLGPCCVTYDGTIRGTKKWGDFPPGSLYKDGTHFYECMGCRKELEEPPPGATADDLEMDEAAWAAVAAVQEAFEAGKGARP